MRIFDCHCDTLVKARREKRVWTAGSDIGQWDLPGFLGAGGRWQVMAVCPGPEMTGDAAASFALDHLGAYHLAAAAEPRVRTVENARDLDAPGDGLGVILALEGAGAFKGRKEMLEAFFRLGVRVVTLTWNHRNELADGIGAGGNHGLTDAGRKMVALMREMGVAVDISHLNEAGFEDVAALLDGGMMASHSNAHAVCPHPRNLRDGQVRALAERGGVVGFNFLDSFVREGGGAGREDFLAHLGHLRKVGGAGILALGGDLDGMSRGVISDARDYPKLLEWASEILDDGELEGFAWRNAFEFFRRTLPASRSPADGPGQAGGG